MRTATNKERGCYSVTELQSDSGLMTARSAKTGLVLAGVKIVDLGLLAGGMTHQTKHKSYVFGLGKIEHQKNVLVLKIIVGSPSFR